MISFAMKTLVVICLLISLGLLSCTQCRGQQFYNLDFKQLCDSSKTGLCFWDLSWGGKGAVKPNVVEGKACLLIQSNTENAVGFAEQAALVEKQTGFSILTISATVKSDNVTGKGAGLNIGLYDSSGILIASKDMGGLYSLDWIRGTNGWKHYSISIICPLATSKIKIGAILFGKGKIWIRDYKVTIASLEDRKPSNLAQEFIGAACDSIQLHSLVRDSIDIKALKETALKIAGPATAYSDCYLAVNYLLESLRPFGDVHSFFMKAEEVRNWEDAGSQVSKIEYPSYRIIDSCGYITVPPFHGGNPTQILAYADSLQAAIRKLYQSGIKGWLIDLRENTGGNMAPMIAGLGPLFSAKKLGILIDADRNDNPWYYDNGSYFWDNDTVVTISDPVRLTTRLPIAVLTGNQTGSSGETVVVSFIGNEKTRSFGQATWGLTTGNGSFALTDGSQIFLASTIMADRNLNLYMASIHPDFIVEGASKDDSVITVAIKWIKKQE